MSKFSTILFLIFLIFLSVHSKKLKEQQPTELVQSSATPVYVYQNLIQYVVPTTTQSCTFFQNKIAEYNIAYTEIQSLSTAACFKAIFDTSVAQINAIINGGQCTAAGPAQPSVSVPSGVSQIWGINGADYIWTINGPSGSWVNIPGGLRYLDRLPQANGGLIYGINSGGGIYRMDGTSGSWQNIPGGLSYLRISAFDKTVWGINSGQAIYWVKDGTTAWTNVPGALKYLDIATADGAVWGANANQDVYYISGVSGSWVNIPGLKTAYLRVISNGYVFALASADGSIYYRPDQASSSTWQQLSGGQNGFTFFDINNNGRIFALKADHSVWSREYIGGSWASVSGQTLLTLRVQDDGTVWGLGVTNYGDGLNDNVYYRNAANTAWTNVPGGLVTLWGPTAIALRLGL